MSDIGNGWRSQLASDIDRDGMGLELLDPSDSIAAEIFRSDREKTLVLTTFKSTIPIEIFDVFYREALARLDPFEDGARFASVGLPASRDR